MRLIAIKYFNRLTALLKIFVHQLAVEKRNMTKATQHLLENWRDDSAWPASNFSVTD